MAATWIRTWARSSCRRFTGGLWDPCPYGLVRGKGDPATLTRPRSRGGNLSHRRGEGRGEGGFMGRMTRRGNPVSGNSDDGLRSPESTPPPHAASVMKMMASRCRMANAPVPDKGMGTKEWGQRNWPIPLSRIPLSLTRRCSSRDGHGLDFMVVEVDPVQGGKGCELDEAAEMSLVTFACGRRQCGEAKRDAVGQQRGGLCAQRKSRANERHTLPHLCLSAEEVNQRLLVEMPDHECPPSIEQFLE